MKRVLIFLTFALALLLTACSYTSNFVIVNATDETIELHYKVKPSGRDPLQMAGEPLRTDEENLRSSDSGWQRLAADEYMVDRGARTIKLWVRPHEAVAVTRLTNYGGHDDTSDAETFPIEEIWLQGRGHELLLRSSEARRAFVAESDNLYTLTFK